MISTRHMDQRMNQRGISRQMVETALLFGIKHNDRCVIGRKEANLAEQVPAQDRGEREEEQADRDEHTARLVAKHRAERALGKVRLIEGAAQRRCAAAGERAVACVKCGDDDEGVERPV